MKKRTFIFRILVTVIFLSGFLLQVGSLRCESQSDKLDKSRSQAKMSDRNSAKGSNWEEQEDKNARFQELEWIIKQVLLKKYEKMEQASDLEYDWLDN
jgi:hypothetical protein